MKTCSECSTSYPLDRLVCLECGEVLEEPLYIRFIGATVVAGALVQLGLSGFGPIGVAFWKGTFMNAALVLAIGYPSWKVVQKLRQPGRPILAEMGSVFADRSDRLMLLALLLFVIVSAPALIPALTDRAGLDAAGAASLSSRLAVFLQWRAVLLTFVAVVVPVAVMVGQGLAFFDPRIANTFILREVQRVLIDDGTLPVDSMD